MAEASKSSKTTASKSTRSRASRPGVIGTGSVDPGQPIVREEDVVQRYSDDAVKAEPVELGEAGFKTGVPGKDFPEAKPNTL